MAHNTLTFNGKKQLVTGNSTVSNLVTTADTTSVELNLTSLYQNDVTNCKRTTAIVSKRYVEIRDMIHAGSKWSECPLEPAHTGGSAENKR